MRIFLGKARQSLLQILSTLMKGTHLLMDKILCLLNFFESFIETLFRNLFMIANMK